MSPCPKNTILITKLGAMLVLLARPSTPELTDSSQITIPSPSIHYTFANYGLQ